MKEIKKPEKLESIKYPKGSDGEKLMLLNKGRNQGIDEYDEYHNQAMKQGINSELLEACEMAREHLQSVFIEPGRTTFWKLVSAIKNAEKAPKRLSKEKNNAR